MKVPHEIDSKGRWVFLIDHHTLSTYNRCPREFYYRFVHENIVTNPTQMSPAAIEAGAKSEIKSIGISPKGRFKFKTQCGIWWSDVMSSIYEAISLNHTCPSLQDCTMYGASAWKQLNMNSYADSTSNTPYEVKNYEKFCGTGFVIPEYPAGAFNMVTEYYNERIKRDAIELKIIATEAGFGLKKEILVGENDYVVVYWVGKPDKIAMDSQGRVMPWDHKTVDYIKSDFNSKWKPHPQTAGYIFAVNQLVKDMNLGKNIIVDRCCINGAARLVPEKPDPRKYRRFERVFPSYSQSELKEWQWETVKKCTRMREDIEGRIVNMYYYRGPHIIFEPKQFVKNEHACHLFGGCSYRQICCQPQEVRDILIQANYQPAQSWMPYNIAEDED